MKFAQRVVVLAAGLVGCGVSTVVYEPDPPPPTSATAPVFGGEAVQAQIAPPPLAGGTVRIVKSSDGVFAVASDPDEDAVDVVALGSSPALVGTVALERGDEPNRMVFDAHGLAHVVLRGGGAIATIDPKSASLVARRAVCPAPRGIDYDAVTDSLYVACATGELVTLPSSGPVSRVVHLDRDLRDVVVLPDKLVVTRFRSAERLVVDATGSIASRATPPAATQANYTSMSPDVAWRTIADGKGDTVMLHQLAATAPLVVLPQQTYYASTGTPISASAIAAGTTPSTVLAVEEGIDVTRAADGTVEVLSLTGSVQIGADGQSLYGANLVSLEGPSYYGTTADNSYEYIGIDDGGRIDVPYKVVQRRIPTAALLVFGDSFQSPIATVALPQKQSHADTGFDIFHIPTIVGSACMTCHPEGADDGHTWKFSVGGKVEARRTQSLRGGVVTDTAPYHWSGDLANLGDLCDEVFTHRMGGGKVEPAQEGILAAWLNAIPRIPARTDLDAARVAAGKAIFEGSGGCSACHVGGTGALATNQDIGKTDVLGQAAPTQVPALLDVVDRAPYMHDGCAATLMDRLTNPACGGSKHGNTAQLGADDLQSLEIYLESL